VQIHCLAHQTNLAVRAIGEFSIIHKLENLCQSLHAYLNKSPKRAMAFAELADELNLGCSKIVRHVKTRWVSVYEPLLRIRHNYQTLVVQMAEKMDMKKYKVKSEKGAHAAKNLDMLCDLDMFLSLPALLPMLSIMNDLIIYAQGRDIYIGDFLMALDMSILDLEIKYCNSISGFSGEDFPLFF
jgi:hypothetical protein